MEHIINLDQETNNRLKEIFEILHEGNTVLFLGAGASITNKKYLSKEIIDYYEGKIGMEYGIDDITEFVDILEATDDFNREEFDLIGFTLRNTDDCAYTSRESFIGEFVQMVRTTRRESDAVIILGGVGAKSVEPQILSRIPEIDIIAYGEDEVSGPILLDQLIHNKNLAGCPNIFYRENGRVVQTGSYERIKNLDKIPYPSYDRIDVTKYNGIGMITSRGCPYKCSFCSVAPVWDHKCHFRPPEDVVAEMKELSQVAGVDLFLFQDEFFVSSKRAVMAFCRALEKSGLKNQVKIMVGGGPITHEFSKEIGADGFSPTAPGGAKLARQLIER